MHVTKQIFIRLPFFSALTLLNLMFCNSICVFYFYFMVFDVTKVYIPCQKVKIWDFNDAVIDYMFLSECNWLRFILGTALLLGL